MTEPAIFQALKADHDTHRLLFEKIAGSGDHPDHRRKVFEQLRIELQAHAAAEEESLYAMMLKDPDLRDSARHSVAEHKEIDDKLAELVKIDEASEGWMQALRDLKQRYLHHIEEEEEEMFPEAHEGFSDDEEREAAETFNERKPEEIELAKDEQLGDERD